MKNIPSAQFSSRFNQIMTVLGRFRVNRVLGLGKQELEALFQHLVRQHKNTSRMMYGNTTFRADGIHPQLLQQIWQKAQAIQMKQTRQLKEKVNVESVIKSICQAIEVVEKIITKNYQKLYQDLQDDENNKMLAQIYEDQQSFIQDYQMLTIPFGLPIDPKVIIAAQFQHQNIRKFLKMQKQSFLPFLSKQNQFESHYFVMNKETMMIPQSFPLKMTLWISMMMLGLQMMLMFQKTHYYTLITVCCVLAIFFLNYFDYIYIRFVIFNLVLSAIKDIIWLYVKFDIFWNPNRFQTQQNIQKTFLKFIIIFVVVIIILKFVQVYFLSEFWEQDNKRTQYVDFISLRFRLQPNPKKNEVTTLLVGKTVKKNFK